MVAYYETLPLGWRIHEDLIDPEAQVSVRDSEGREIGLGTILESTVFDWGAHTVGVRIQLHHEHISVYVHFGRKNFVPLQITKEDVLADLLGYAELAMAAPAYQRYIPVAAPLTRAKLQELVFDAKRRLIE